MSVSRRGFLTMPLAVPALGAGAAGWKAGVAVADITPTEPTWMAGFAARTKPSDGCAQALHAKALAIEDPSGQRTVLVTADTLGFPPAVAARIAEGARARHGLTRERLLLNASHTHGGAVLDGILAVAYPMKEEHWPAVHRHTAMFEQRVAGAIDAALAKLQPVTLRYGSTSAPFAVNFRTLTPKGWVHAANPAGVVDRTVPVIRIDDAAGKPFAVVFGYACHPTITPGIYQFHGDYAGFAQVALEKRYAGLTAFFVQGCGGDAKVDPRGTIELAKAYGELLGAVTAHAMEGKLEPLAGPIACAFETLSLPFKIVPTREQILERGKSTSVFDQRIAKKLLLELDRDGKLAADLKLPIQVWRLSPNMGMVAFGGETLVDYALRLKRELPSHKLFVAGYSNSVEAYIPSERVLNEGGYEGGEAMVYYGKPSPFAAGVEEKIVARAHALMRQTGLESA